MKFLFKLVILFIFLSSFSAQAQQTDVAEYFDDGNVSVNKNIIKLGFNPFKGEISFSFERGLGTLGAIEAGLGLINTEKIYNVRYYDTFMLPNNILLKSNTFNVWAEPKIYLNENYHKFYVGGFFGITKMPSELLKDLALNFGYKQRIVSNISLELLCGIGARFYTRILFPSTLRIKDNVSSIVFPLMFKLGYSF